MTTMIFRNLSNKKMGEKNVIALYGVISSNKVLCLWDNLFTEGFTAVKLSYIDYQMLPCFAVKKEAGPDIITHFKSILIKTHRLIAFCLCNMTN